MKAMEASSTCSADTIPSGTLQTERIGPEKIVEDSGGVENAPNSAAGDGRVSSAKSTNVRLNSLPQKLFSYLFFTHTMYNNLISTCQPKASVETLGPQKNRFCPLGDAAATQSSFEPGNSSPPIPVAICPTNVPLSTSVADARSSSNIFSIASSKSTSKKQSPCERLQRR
jgi:hypothetical protein